MSRVRVDVARVRKNIAAFHSRAAVPVRAHVKGHRTVEIARMQLEAGACGIAVTRPQLARPYVAAGFEDIVAAWPWRDPSVLDRFAGLAADCRLSVHVDDIETVEILSRAARRHGVRVGVRVQVDRTTDVEAIARAVESTRELTLDGVVGYQALLSAEDALERSASAREQAQQLVESADRLRSGGLPCPVVAFGGTPSVDALVPGITELGAGAYPLGDAGLVALGLHELDDIAVTVDPADAELMADCGQPWHPQPWVGRGDELVPSHICPLVLRVPLLHTSTGESWTVLGREDLQ